MKRVAFMFLLTMAVALGGCGGAAAAAAAGKPAVSAGTDTGTEKNEAGATKEDGGSETAKEAADGAEAGKMPEGEEAEDKDGGAADDGTGRENPDGENAQNAAGGDTEEEKREPQLADYEITVFGTEEVMYASVPVNVRKGPTTDFERIGGLKRGQEAAVTGQADTGWYEIAYGEGKAYVSNKYLQREKPEEEAVPQQASGQAAEGAASEAKNVAGVIMVGDSRCVQMQQSVGENSCTWIAESSKGYKWLNDTAVAKIDACVGSGSKILINLGVNDPGHLKDYLTLVNAKAAEWVEKGATVYYASVNPVWDNPYVTEEQVQYFNSQMQAGLSGDVHWIDSHGYLSTVGYKLVDGLHFDKETYQNLYAYYMSCL